MSRDHMKTSRAHMENQGTRPSRDHMNASRDHMKTSRDHVESRYARMSRDHTESHGIGGRHVTTAPLNGVSKL